MGTEIVPVESSAAIQVVPAQAMTREQVDLVKRTVAKGATNDELQLFLYTAQRMGLDPLARQIHAIKRWDNQSGREVMAIQTGIDGYRLIAERTGKYAGQEGPFWCGEDGIWRDVWLSSKPPAAAKVGVLKVGFAQPLYRIALYSEYAQRKKDGSPTRMWADRAAGQLAKCAEALGLRAAFPAELSGVYTNEEMQQADSERDETRPATQPRQSAPPADREPGSDDGEKTTQAPPSGTPSCGQCGSINVVPDGDLWLRCNDCKKGTKRG